jgi:hypothetical protein
VLAAGGVLLAVVLYYAYLHRGSATATHFKEDWVRGRTGL